MGLDEVQGRDEVLFKVEGVLRRQHTWWVSIMCMVGKIQHGCFLEWYK